MRDRDVTAGQKIVERFAEYCGLADKEKRWLVAQVGRKTGPAQASPVHSACGESHPSVEELDAFDTVVRDLLDKRQTSGRARIDSAELRAKVARGCLRGVEAEEQFLTDETIVAAVDALHSAGAFEPEDVHHLATFLGQLDHLQDFKHLASVCEDLVRLDSLTEVHRLDLVLSMVACAQLPLAVRAQILEAVATGPSLPEEIVMELLERVVCGESLYGPYWYESADDYLDARPSWIMPATGEQRDSMVSGLADLAGQLTQQNRDRSAAELDELDAVLDWLDSMEGTSLFEQLALRMAERLPDFWRDFDAGAHDAACDHPPGRYACVPELEPFEPVVQQACDETGAPRRAVEIVIAGLGYVIDGLRHLAVDPSAFSAGISGGDSETESNLLDVTGHVLDCVLHDSLNLVYVPLQQFADLRDEDLSRLRELALAVRDGLLKGATDTVPADLVELLSPFDGRTAARLNRVAEESLSFAAARLLADHFLPRKEVARVAGPVWTAESLAGAGEYAAWAAQLVADFHELFDADLVASAKNGGGARFETPGYVN
ncbi:MAG: hypothetical protein HY816_02850 [Candidatus Wallbacteria bacterium]|nr:hypothetical protein [Candidatus Wallbacteria bacterium]